MSEFNIKNIVKDNQVEFLKFRQGIFYYGVWVDSQEDVSLHGYYIFPVPLDDIGDATMDRKDKAIIFMRWIRKAIEDKTLVRFNG